MTLAIVLAAAPGAAIQTALFGPGVLGNLAVAGCTAVVCEAVVALARGTRRLDLLRELRDNLSVNSGALVTALLLALALPPGIPFWLVGFGVGVGLGVGKYAFEGAPCYPFNPAMLGYAALLALFPTALATWPGIGADAISGATPLDLFKHRGGQTVADLWLANPAFGLFGERAWSWLNAGYLAGGLALVVARLIDWRIPLAMLASIGALAAAGYDAGSSSSLGSPVFHAFSGATMLGAFFIATDPATAPRTHRGRIGFGVAVGALTFLLRSASNFPDGIALAVLLGNALTVGWRRDSVAEQPHHAVLRVALLFGLAVMVVSSIGAGMSHAERTFSVVADLPVRVCQSDGATAYRTVRASRPGYGGPIEIWLTVDATDTVTAVRVTRLGETRGFAAESASGASRWLATSIAGVELSSAAQLRLSDNGGSIDAITGATITSQALVTAVRDAALALINAPSLDCSQTIDTSASAQP